MFTLFKKRGSYLEKGKGASPSDEVGQENASPHDELAKQHRTLADTHAGIADTHEKMAGGAAPEAPPGERPGPEPAEDIESLLGGEESPAHEAAESPQLEADEKLGNLREQGGSLRNSKDEKTPLSRFAALRKKGKGGKY
jgi:hypothetical protein